VPRGNHIKAQTSSAHWVRVNLCKSQLKRRKTNDHETHEPLLGLMLWEMMKLLAKAKRVTFIMLLPQELSPNGKVMFSPLQNKTGW
jgi:hypothetical protein